MVSEAEFHENYSSETESDSDIVTMTHPMETLVGLEKLQIFKKQAMLLDHRLLLCMNQSDNWFMRLW